jgi:pimeloyl-ACP methyl ester carboxylesterase
MLATRAMELAIFVVLWTTAIFIFSAVYVANIATGAFQTACAWLGLQSRTVKPASEAKPFNNYFHGGVVSVTQVNGIATEIMTWESCATSAGDTDAVFIMFPGNPGAVEFYSAFLGRMHERSVQCGVPLRIVCVGHASHSKRVACSSAFSLADQIQHKVSFVQMLLESNPRTSVILAGHSVGAHMVLEVAKRLPAERLLDAVLLFPTVRNIGSTPNGLKLMPFFQRFKGAAWLFTHAIAGLPIALQHAVLRPFMPGADGASLHAALSLLHPDVAYNALFMALHEMMEIRQLHIPDIDVLQDKLFFYFAAKDDWVHAEDPYFFQSNFPRAKVQICNKGHKHAYVLSKLASQDVADTVWESVVEASIHRASR